MATAPENPIAPMTDEMRNEMATKLVAEMKRQMDIEEADIAEARATGTISKFEVPIDQQGHLCAYYNTARRTSLDRILARSDKDVITASVNPETGDDCTFLTVASVAEATQACQWCGQHPEFSYDGTVVRAVTACESPDGFSTVFTLTVTSGKIVIADDLSYVYASAVVDRPRTELGKSRSMRAIAESGHVFGFTPKIPSTLFQTGENTYAIVAPGHDENWEPNHVEGTALADLDDEWSYAFADHDDYLSKGGTINEEWMSVVEVPNGTYTFTHHTTERTFDGDDFRNPLTIATIVRTDA